MRKYISLLGIVFVLAPSTLHAQVFQELITRQSLAPLDSNSTFASLWLSNTMSKIPDGRDFMSKNNAKVQYVNPALIMEIVSDLTFRRSINDFHIFIGWQGKFFPDELMSRTKVSLVKKDMVYSLFGSMRIIRDDKNGDIENRQGSFSNHWSLGLGVEQHQEYTSIVLEGEHSGIRSYHLAEVSGRLQSYPSFWIALRSESLRGYGPRVYYKSPNMSLWVHGGMNFAPPAYRDHRYVRNSVEFGIRHVFF